MASASHPMAHFCDSAPISEKEQRTKATSEVLNHTFHLSREPFPGECVLGSIKELWRSASLSMMMPIRNAMPTANKNAKRVCAFISHRPDNPPSTSWLASVAVPPKMTFFCEPARHIKRSNGAVTNYRLPEEDGRDGTMPETWPWIMHSCCLFVAKASKVCATVQERG